MSVKPIPPQTLRRLPVYLHYLRGLRERRKHVSATAISEALGLGEVQVRKDLSAVSVSGRPKVGYGTDGLIADIRHCLCCETEARGVLVGAGNLGKALMMYDGFGDYGLTLVAAFDADTRLSGAVFGGTPILPMEDMERVCERENVRLGVIAVPEAAAQHVCDRLVACGVRAIWNFAPILLKAPRGVCVQNENLAASLAVLARYVSDEERGDQGVTP